jgi:uncharacterized membrane protein
MTSVAWHRGRVSPERRDRNIRFTAGAILGMLVSVLAIGCGVAYLVTEHKAFLAAGVVLMVAGQVIYWIHMSRRTRREEARRMKQ